MAEAEGAAEQAEVADEQENEAPAEAAATAAVAGCGDASTAAAAAGPPPAARTSQAGRWPLGPLGAMLARMVKREPGLPPSPAQAGASPGKQGEVIDLTGDSQMADGF